MNEGENSKEWDWKMRKCKRGSDRVIKQENRGRAKNWNKEVTNCNSNDTIKKTQQKKRIKSKI